MARKGKIASLPGHVREQVNQRLFNGETGRQIIAWLHTLPEVLQVLDDNFGEEPVSEKNLSEWRNSKTGYQRWLDRRDRLHTLKSLADYSVNLADQGRRLMDGTAAIVGGQLLEIFESVDPEVQKKLLEDKPGDYIKLISALAGMQDVSNERAKVALVERRLEQAERKLDLEVKRFQRQTAELFIKYAEDEEARRVAVSKESKTIKLDRLVQLMFGQAPERGE